MSQKLPNPPPSVRRIYCACGMPKDQHHVCTVTYRALAAELAGYKRALRCANQYVAELDPLNGRAVFAIPFTAEEMTEADASGEVNP